MLSTSFIKRVWVLLTILHVSNAQDDQSVLLLSGSGLVGSVVAATGCDLTYELTCTNSDLCTDVIKTVTLNGPSSYTMNYASIGTTDAGYIIESISETCALYGTTVAYCHVVAAVTVATLSTSSISSFVLTAQGDLGYSQVPMTAGPPAALRSASSCSLNGGKDDSTATSTQRTTTSETPTKAANTDSSKSTTTADSGLSTGAKAGIGAGVGVGVVAFAAVGGFLLYRRKRKSRVPQQQTPNTMTKLDNSQWRSGVYEVEQPFTKHEMPVAREAQELPGYQRSYELPTDRR